MFPRLAVVTRPRTKKVYKNLFYFNLSLKKYIGGVRESFTSRTVCYSDGLSTRSLANIMIVWLLIMWNLL